MTSAFLGWTGWHCKLPGKSVGTGRDAASHALSGIGFRGVRAMDRRHLLKNSLSLIGLGATSQAAVAQAARVPLMDRPPRLAPIRAHVDRIYDMKSCLRPFRTKGPNLGVER